MDTQEHEEQAEVVAFALLRIIADNPGSVGRLRTARIVNGISMPEHQGLVDKYSVPFEWPTRDVTALLDSLMSGGLATQTLGTRPTMVLTRQGFWALAALEREEKELEKSE